MRTSKILLPILGSIVLAAAPLYAQFPGRGDDNTSSLGTFKIQVNNTFSGLVNGCPGYDSTSQILTSPTLYDGATTIGRSDVIKDGDANDTAGVAVGLDGTVIGENILFPPTDFPCDSIAGCTSGAGTREVHTEVRRLKMVSGAVAVRAGKWYNNATVESEPPAGYVSPGEVESQSGPTGAAANDFPASSFFDVFVRVDLPACGGLPDSTLYNDSQSPLLVKNYSLTAFPPKVVYLHDSSSVVPIRILNGGPTWNAGDIVGSFILAGHGVGFSNSDCDIKAFNDFMSCAASKSSSGSHSLCIVSECISQSINSTATPTKTAKPATKKR